MDTAIGQNYGLELVEVVAVAVVIDVGGRAGSPEKARIKAPTKCHFFFYPVTRYHSYLLM